MATAEDLNASAFLKMLPSLVERHSGQYVLIHGGERVGLYPSEEKAFDEGYSRFQLEPFFVGAIEAPNQLAAVSRFISL